MSEKSVCRKIICAPRLPSGYTELEYITGSGSAYIITPLTSFKNTYKYRFKVRRYGATTRFLFGENPGTTTDNIGGFDYNNGYYLQNGANTRVAVAVAMGDFHEIIIESDGYTVDGTKTSVTAAAEFMIEKAFLLFAAWSGSSVDSRMSTDAIALCEVYDEDGELIMQLIPCENSSDVASMYDLVSGTFLTPASGTFTAGPVTVNGENVIDKLTVGGPGGNLYNEDETAIASLAELQAITKPTASRANILSAPAVGGTIRWGGVNIRGIAIPCKQGDSYSWKEFGTTTAARRQFVEIDADGTILKTTTNYTASGKSYTITMAACAYLLVEFELNATQNMKMVVVEGSTIPAEYLPYWSEKEIYKQEVIY